MIPRAVAVDTAVLAYALGAEHVEREPCRAVLEASRRAQVELHASWELITELIFHRMRKVDRHTAVAQARDAVGMLAATYDVDRAVVARSMDLILTSQIRGRAAIHAATALEHGLTHIVSTDPAFDDVPGLTLLRPRDFATSSSSATADVAAE